jgi:S1-C subfamily serine protease
LWTGIIGYVVFTLIIRNTAQAGTQAQLSEWCKTQKQFYSTPLERGAGLWDISPMRFLAGIFMALLALPALAAEKMTAVTIDGTSYVQIQDVHVVSGGRIVIMYASGGTTVTAEKLPKGFLASWGITAEELAVSKAAAEKQAELLFAQAVRAGVFREVDGVVYDLRRSQSGWRQFSDARIVQVVEDGALVDPTPYQATTTAVFVRNLPHIFADNEKASFMAKSTGDFSYVNKFGFEHTIHSYDVGRVCQRNEIPDAMVKGGLAAANSPFAARPEVAERADRVDRPEHAERAERPVSPGGAGLRGIGSGFFITKDGYLLTNFHVVKEAGRVEVKYKTRVFKAEVVEVDAENDLALLKVSGTDFATLAISHKDSADLGDEVFTIGFPNIEMQGLAPKYTDGKISSLAGMQDDPSEYQISVPVQPGNSGGPLCDVNGEVVGIVVSRLNDMVALRESGAVPQNVNYAVKAKQALRLLDNVKGLEALLLPAKAAAKPAKPVQAVEDAIAMILIY